MEEVIIIIIIYCDWVFIRWQQSEFLPMLIIGLYYEWNQGSIDEEIQRDYS